jgi:multicomponent Na+:H+ antiporter subunit E
MTAFAPVLWRCALFTLLWWVLAGGRADSWGVGVVAVALATLASLRLLPAAGQRISPIGLLRFTLFFLYQSLRGGLQVAWFALRPNLALHPAFHDVALRLPEGGARVLLANTLNLLPGTLSVELEGDRLCLHVLDASLPAEKEVRAAETRLAHLFGLSL